jgi:hypothetical protein
LFLRLASGVKERKERCIPLSPIYDRFSLLGELLGLLGLHGGRSAGSGHLFGHLLEDLLPACIHMSMPGCGHHCQGNT